MDSYVLQILWFEAQAERTVSGLNALHLRGRSAQIGDRTSEAGDRHPVDDGDLIVGQRRPVNVNVLAALSTGVAVPHDVHGCQRVSPDRQIVKGCRGSMAQHGSWLQLGHCGLDHAPVGVVAAGIVFVRIQRAEEVGASSDRTQGPGPDESSKLSTGESLGEQCGCRDDGIHDADLSTIRIHPATSRCG
jgi:hypothetical protein